MQEVVVVTTDIDAPTATPFGDETAHPLDINPDTDGSTRQPVSLTVNTANVGMSRVHVRLLPV